MLHKKKAPTHSDLSVIEVKSKFEAEFRRFSIKRDTIKNYQAFYKLVKETHRLDGIVFSLWYRDPLHGDLLPINNSENCLHALNVAQPMLRVFVQRQGFEDVAVNGGTLDSKKKGLFGTLSASGAATTIQPHNRRLMIGTPQDFRRVSAIIDVDILPDTVRRVRLCKHNSNKPLGFYIRDGTSVRMVNNSIEKCPGIFISRLVPKGLAESTGLLSVNDEVLEVNGIEVAGKSLDQVTDMMVANSHNLIITVKPVNQETRSDGSMLLEGDTAENANIRRIVSTKAPGKANGNGNYNGAVVDHGMEPIQDSDDEESAPVISDGIVHV